MLVSARIRLHGMLRLLGPDETGEIVVVLEEPASVGQMLSRLSGSEKAWIVARGKRVVRHDEPVTDGAVFDVFGQLEGG